MVARHAKPKPFCIGDCADRIGEGETRQCIKHERINLILGAEKKV